MTRTQRQIPTVPPTRHRRPAETGADGRGEANSTGYFSVRQEPDHQKPRQRLPSVGAGGGGARGQAVGARTVPGRRPPGKPSEGPSPSYSPQATQAASAREKIHPRPFSTVDIPCFLQWFARVTGSCGPLKAARLSTACQVFSPRSGACIQVTSPLRGSHCRSETSARWSACNAPQPA